MNSTTVATLLKQKQAGEKIACLTAYDYSFAALLDRNEVDAILVGDSLGMVMQGHVSREAPKMQWLLVICHLVLIK